MNSITIGKAKLSGDTIELSARQRMLHTLLVAPTGMGSKALLIEPILKQDVENKEEGLTYFDTDGSVSETVYALAKKNRRKVLNFNPLLHQVKFNPLNGSEEAIVIRLLSLIKTEDMKSGDFFYTFQESLIRYSVKILYFLTKGNMNLKILADFVNNEKGYGESCFAKYKNKNEYIDQTMQNFMTDYFSKDSNVYEYTVGFRVVLYILMSNSKISHIFDISKQENEKELNFEEHMKNKDIVLINIPSPELGKEVSSLLRNLIASTFATTVMNHKTREIHHLFVEELALYGDNFDELFSIARAYNVSIFATTQSISYLAKRRKGEAILLNIRNYMLFALSMGDRKYLENLYLTDEELNSLYFSEVGEMYAHLMNPNGQIIKHRILLTENLMTKEEKLFIEKRVKRYKKNLEI